MLKSPYSRDHAEVDIYSRDHAEVAIVSLLHMNFNAGVCEENQRRGADRSSP